MESNFQFSKCQIGLLRVHLLSCVAYTEEFMLSVVGWSVIPKSLMLLPENLESMSVDLFACKKVGASTYQLSPTEPMAIVFSSAALTGCYKVASIASEEIRKSALGSGNKIQNFSLSQLLTLYEGMMVQEIYRQWLVPVYKDPASIVEISANMHCPIQLLLLSDQSEDSHEQDVMTPRADRPLRKVCSPVTSPAHGTTDGISPLDFCVPQLENTLTLMVNGLGVHLHGSQTFISIPQLKVTANAALIESMVLNIVSAMMSNDIGSEFALEDLIMERSQSEGTTIEIVIPSPSAKGGVSREGAKIKLVEAKGALNGITITAPSILASLRRQNAEIDLDGRAVQVRIDGLAAKGILEKHFDSQSEAKQAWYVIDSQLDTLAEGVSIDESKLLKAIEVVSNLEMAKAKATRAVDGKLKLDRLAIIAGQLIVGGRVSDHHKNTWLHLFSEGNQPVWQLHGSLASPKRVSNAMDILIADENVSSFLKERALEWKNATNDAAIDYHDISLEKCTLLVYVAPIAISDFMHCVNGILEHKPSSPCPDYLYFHLKSLRLELVNTWPSCGLLYHTSSPIGVTEFNWDWTPMQIKLWLLGFITWFLFTLDIMPG